MAEGGDNQLQQLKNNIEWLDIYKRDRSDDDPASFNQKPLCGDTSEGFIESLKTQKQNFEEEATTREKKLDDALKKSVREELKSLTGAEKNVTEEKVNRIIDLVRMHMREDIKQKNKPDGKSDLDSSGSTWDWDLMTRHAHSLKVSSGPGVERPGTIDEDIMRKIRNRMADNSKALLGITVPDVEPDVEPETPIQFLEKLQKTKLSETTSRAFIDSLLFPLLIKNDLRVELEEKLYKPKQNKIVPNSITDYLVVDSAGSILGTIEAKAAGELWSKSAIQCILQAMSLRTKEPQILFGILTDSIHYFCFLLEDGTLVFEDPDRRDHTLITWRSVLDVARVLDGYLNVRRNRSVPNLCSVLGCDSQGTGQWQQQEYPRTGPKEV